MTLVTWDQRTVVCNGEIRTLPKDVITFTMLFWTAPKWSKPSDASINAPVLALGSLSIFPLNFQLPHTTCGIGPINRIVKTVPKIFPEFIWKQKPQEGRMDAEVDSEGWGYEVGPKSCWNFKFGVLAWVACLFVSHDKNEGLRLEILGWLEMRENIF